MRANTDLFDWEETEKRHTPQCEKRRRASNYYTVAAVGLRSIIERQHETWKGWSVISFPKTFITARVELKTNAEPKADTDAALISSPLPPRAVQFI